jgi:hypothetical protein
LSIYPDTKFDPQVETDSFIPLAPVQATLEPILTSPSTSLNPTLSALLSLAKAILPASFFGADEKVETIDLLAPIPSPITPLKMKKAVTLLSSPGLVTDVGEGSPNLLVFNNYTSSRVMEKFWRDLA